MNFRDYLNSAEGIAQVKDIVGLSTPASTFVNSVTALKNKWAALGGAKHGQVDSIIVNTAGFDPAVILPMTYSAVTNKWYSQPETIFNVNTAVARSTAAAAAVGTQITMSQEQYLYTNFQSYLSAGLTAQMMMFATGQSNTATAFPIARFRAVKSTTNPVNVTGATPANLLQLNLVTAIAVSSGILGMADVNVTGTGSHLWGDAVFEVGGAAAQISGYYLRVDLRWRTS